ncbi:MAG: class I tRNA ligase family protein, partial [Lachnospiraceae bacterium]|nr:class I tRNA ligase family protein [Lachnospiraceae bacterium]
VTSDFEQLGFNTAISQMMIFVNEVYKAGKCPREYAEGLVKMFSCICPHVGEELWTKLGHDNTIAYENWPQYDEAKTIENTVEIAVQVNGKIKATIAIARDEAQDSVLAKAREAIEGKVTGNIVKEIYVPGRIVNIVVK